MGFDLIPCAAAGWERQVSRQEHTRDWAGRVPQCAPRSTGWSMGLPRTYEDFVVLLAR